MSSWKSLWIVFLRSQLGVAKTIVRDDREYEANSVIQRTPTEVSSTVPPDSILEVVSDGKRSCNHANLSQNIPNNEEIGSLVDNTVNKREHEEHQGFQDLQSWGKNVVEEAKVNFEGLAAKLNTLYG